MEGSDGVTFDNQSFRAGQLTNHLSVWKKLGAPKPIISIIKGYVIPFSKKPPITALTPALLERFRTPTSLLMDQEITKMIQEKTMIKLNCKTGFLSKMFLTPKSDGQWRPVFNLKRLNEYVKLQKFRLVSHRKLQYFLQKGDYMAKIDLSQAYLHIPIATRHWRYLALHYRSSTYALTALPFGLSSAPQIFAKVINWVAMLLRKQNMRLIVYLDDFLIVNQNPRLLKNEVAIVVKTLTDLGFKINWEKSALKPTKEITFLGVIWNTELNLKRLPEQKIQSLEMTILKFLKSGKWNWKQAKSILGKMEFASFVIPLARLHCRKIQRSVNRLPEFMPNLYSKIKPENIPDLQWWLANLEQRSKIIMKEPEVHLVTDASNTGWGAELEDHLITGLWNTSQKKLAHKQERNVRGLQNFIQLPSHTTKQECSHTMRQQNCGSIHKEPGWNKISKTPKTCRRNLDYGQTHEYRHTNRTYSRSLQHNIRPFIQRQKFTRLASVKPDNRNHFQEMGYPMHRSIRNSEIGSSDKICHTIPMPSGRICECIHKDMGLQTRMDIPPSAVSTQDSTTPQPMSRDLHIDCSQMEECILAADTQEKICGQTIHHKEPIRPFDRSSNQPTSSQNTRFVLGSMESTGWADLVRDWSTKEKEILETSWRKSSLGTYSTAWKSWCLWAKDKNVSINNPNPTEVAQYLCYLCYKKNMSYRTICLHKSTIATFSNPLNSEKLSSNPIIKHTLKGISNTNPQTLRAKIWDVNKLLTWICRNPPDPVNLFQVSRHLAILLLLSSGRRVHDLTLLRIDGDYMEHSENEVIFWPQYGSKTDKLENIQSGWKLLKNDQEIWDIVQWTKKYINISHSRRHANNQIIPHLFVKTRGKTGPASRSVIAGWVRTALLSAGIEAGAGSTRSAVATYRFNNCLPLDEVLKRGNWQGPNNFFKHYYKEIDNSTTSETNINNSKAVVTQSFVPL